ncbi:MAG: sulfur carrier protein ThiS [Gracilibacteraceae bacterium]|jgi:sulfur carrier protein|nr:sulfur carrier protein ThiS [Gracilibacteraceae bacterium]
MLVNGQEKKLQTPATLMEFLRAEGYGPERVAVERNGAIVPRPDYDAVRLAEGDELEIVCFVGGG